MTSPQAQVWQQHIRQWRDSGLSQAQYCKQSNLKESAFSYHKCKQAKQKTTDNLVSAKNTGFIVLPRPQIIPAHEPLTLHFTSGLSLSGIAVNNIELVKQLSEALS